MLGEKANSLQANAWYLLACHGDLVLRLRPGTQFGEDPAGELCFEPADAEMAVDITDEGALVLLAGAGRDLEVTPGNRVRRVEVGRQSCVQVSLPGNVLSLTTDFAAPPRAEEFLQIRTVPAAHSDSAVAVLQSPYRLPVATPGPEPPGDTGLLGDCLIVVPETAPAQAAPQRKSLVSAIAAFAVGSAAALTAAYVLWQPQIDTPVASAVVEKVAEPAPPPPASASDPTVAELLASVSAMLDAGTLPDESALEVTLQSLKALQTAYPEDARVRSQLEALTERLATAARITHDGGDGALAKRLIDQASSTGVARDHVTGALTHMAAFEAGATAAATRDPAQPAAAGATAAGSRADEPRREPADSAESTSAPAPRPTPAPPAVADPAPSPALVAELERIGAEVRAMAAQASSQRDVRAAAAALERGMLMGPTAANAYALYTRALMTDPDSQAARGGLQAVREAILARARVFLAADDLGAVMSTLDDADLAGADPAMVDDLRAEVRFRQRLQDARAGRFDRLHPITDLKAIRQDPPLYPRYAPSGSEASVEMEITVTESGDVRDVAVLGDPPSYFVRAAKAAVEKWQFEPVVERGRPIPVRTTLRVTFRG